MKSVLLEILLLLRGIVRFFAKLGLVIVLLGDLVAKGDMLPSEKIVTFGIAVLCIAILVGYDKLLFYLCPEDQTLYLRK